MRIEDLSLQGKETWLNPRARLSDPTGAVPRQDMLLFELPSRFRRLTTFAMTVLCDPTESPDSLTASIRHGDTTKPLALKIDPSPDERRHLATASLHDEIDAYGLWVFELAFQGETIANLDIHVMMGGTFFGPKTDDEKPPPPAIGVSDERRQELIQRCHEEWAKIPAPDPLKLFDFEYQPETLTYEDVEVYEMFAGLHYTEVDCSIVQNGIFANPFYWLNADSTFYYLGGFIICILRLSADNDAESLDTYGILTDTFRTIEVLSAFNPTELNLKRATILSDYLDVCLHIGAVWQLAAYEVSKKAVQTYIENHSTQEV